MKRDDFLQSFPRREEKEIIECLSELTGALEARILVASWRESIKSEQGTLASSIVYWLDQSKVGSPKKIEIIEEIIRKYKLPFREPLKGSSESEFEKSFRFFVDYLSKITKREPDEVRKKLEHCKTPLKEIWRDLENRRERVLYEVGGATGKSAMDSFIEALSNKEASLIWLPTFSAETFREKVEPILKKRILDDHCQVQILMYSNDLMEYFESAMKQRAVAQIDKMKQWMKGIRGQLPKKRQHLLQIRLLPKKARNLGYFTGLLTFREFGGEFQPLVYRINVHEKPGMRGTHGKMIQGEGNTTLFQILEHYFTTAWHQSMPIEYYQNWRAIFWELGQGVLPLLQKRKPALLITLILGGTSLVITIASQNPLGTVISALFTLYLALYQIFTTPSP